jgi:hypothetical protein
MMLSLKLLFEDSDNDLGSADSGVSERCSDCKQKTKVKVVFVKLLGSSVLRDV